jgi:hypothetical protein
MSTGMSAYLVKQDNGNLNNAKNQLKVASYQQQLLNARIIKLQKEEEKAQKRIKDANRQANFMEEIHKLKSNKLSTKADHNRRLKEMEETNRNKFIEARYQSKQIIKQNKERLMKDHMDSNKEIKEQRKKIEETIEQAKSKTMMDKYSHAQEIYQAKKEAKMFRSAVRSDSEQQALENYHKKVNFTQKMASDIQEQTRQLEEKEAMLIAKL